MWAPHQSISLTRHVCWLVSVPNYRDRSRLAEEGLEKRPLKTGGKTCRSILIATASSKKLASWRSALRHERHSRSTGGSRMPSAGGWTRFRPGGKMGRKRELMNAGRLLSRSDRSDKVEGFHHHEKPLKVDRLDEV